MLDTTGIKMIEAGFPEVLASAQGLLQHRQVTTKVPCIFLKAFLRDHKNNCSTGSVANPPGGSYFSILFIS